MALICPGFAGAADYAPENTLWVICDQGNLARAARTRMDEMGLALDSL